MSEAHQEQMPSLDWTPCPPGELGRLSQRLRHKRHRREFLRTAIVGGSAVVAVGASVTLWTLATAPQEVTVGGLTCTQVRNMANDYAQGNLQKEVHKQVEEHLSHCDRCQKYYEREGIA